MKPRTVGPRHAAALAGFWIVLAFVNWWWAMSASPHARPLLLVLIALGAIAGLGVGILTAAAWRALAIIRGGAVPGPAAFTAAVGIISAPALGALLGGLRAMEDMPYRRLIAVLYAIALAAAALAGAWYLARGLQYVAARPGAAAGLRLARVAVAWGCLPLLAALVWYVSTGRTVDRVGEPVVGRPAAARPLPHIVLVSFDTLRPDHLSAYGYGRPTSPRIDAAISEGTMFTQAIASSSWTIPSHATLFTGASPSRIGASMTKRVDSGELALPPEAVTLAEVLGGHGYHTAAFIGSAAMHSIFGFAQGFEVYDEMPPPSMPAYADRLFFAEEIRWLIGTERNRFLESLTPVLLNLSNLIHGQSHLPPPAGFTAHSRHPRRMWDMAVEVNAKVRAFLDTDPAGPLFLFVHYFDTHNPFDAPPPFAGRWGNDGKGFGYINSNGLLRRVVYDGRRLSGDEADRLAGLYDEEVASVDDGFGRLMEMLEARGILENAILVLFSDHGESLGDHGDLFHGNSLDEELIRILLAIKAPGRVPAGGRVMAQVAAVDIMPTILDLAGIDAPGDDPREGRTLVPLMNGVETGDEAQRPVFSELYAGGMQGFDTGPFSLDFHAVRAGGWKLVQVSDGSRRLYRISDDPGEMIDLAGADPEVAGRLSGLLSAWIAAGAAGGEGTREILPERLEQLRSLGYVGGD